MTQNTSPSEDPDARNLGLLQELNDHLMGAVRIPTLQPAGAATAPDSVLINLAAAVHRTIQLETALRHHRDVPPRPRLTKVEQARLEIRRNRIKSHASRIVAAETPSQPPAKLLHQLTERLDDHDLTQAIDTRPVAETAIRLCQALGVAQNPANWPVDLRQALEQLA